MKRNPGNILRDRFLQAATVAGYGLRSAIISKRLDKFEKIDLRKFKSDPNKKKRIRLIIEKLGMVKFGLLTQMMILSSQPIPIFEAGGLK